jgi:hypothetical protein
VYAKHVLNCEYIIRFITCIIMMGYKRCKHRYQQQSLLFLKTLLFAHFEGIGDDTHEQHGSGDPKYQGYDCKRLVVSHIVIDDCVDELLCS